MARRKSNISVPITGDLERELSEAARRLDIAPEELAAAAVRDLLARQDADFQETVKRILEKNRELYRRLS